MAVLKLKYVNSYRDRLGKQRHYFRKGGIRVPLDGVPGSAVFMEEYQALLAQHAPVITRRGKPDEGTVDWVITQYRAKSKKWERAKPSSREVYERRFRYLSENFGGAEFASFTEKAVREIRNRLRDEPSVADATKKMIGRLWAFSKEHLGMSLGPNPATEVAAIHTEHQAHKAWPQELCTAVEAHEDPNVVRAYYLLRYTGQHLCVDAGTQGTPGPSDGARGRIPPDQPVGQAVHRQEPVDADSDRVLRVGVRRLFGTWTATFSRVGARGGRLFCS
jgi:hypothetical protein